jgi:hypothetical protein
MILDQGFWGWLNRFFHWLELLRDIQAGTALRQHFQGASGARWLVEGV